MEYLFSMFLMACWPLGIFVAYKFIALNINHIEKQSNKNEIN